jgi:hemolysin D
MRRDLHERQTGSRLQLLEATSQVLTLRGQFNDLKNRESELLHEQSAIMADSQAFTGEWQRKLSEELIQTRRERDDVAERLAKAERRSSLVSLIAPVDAVVLEMAKLSVGSIVKDAEPLVKLVPLNVPLELEVEIAARDIGLIEPGAPVRIKLDAFPFQRHGTLDGDVRTISADAFQRPADQTGGAYYRTRVRLLNTHLRDVPENRILGPGMVVQAEIKVGTRSVLSYLLYPVIRMLDESIREP